MDDKDQRRLAALAPGGNVSLPFCLGCVSYDLQITLYQLTVDEDCVCGGAPTAITVLDGCGARLLVCKPWPARTTL